jgi:hypothetical protein
MSRTGKYREKRTVFCRTASTPNVHYQLTPLRRLGLKLLSLPRKVRAAAENHGCIDRKGRARCR